jgi:hypothetical protein
MEIAGAAAGVETAVGACAVVDPAGACHGAPGGGCVDVGGAGCHGGAGGFGAGAAGTAWAGPVFTGCHPPVAGCAIAGFAGTDCPTARGTCPDDFGATRLAPQKVQNREPATPGPCPCGQISAGAVVAMSTPSAVAQRKIQ